MRSRGLGSPIIVALLLLLTSTPAGMAHAQCILANPSFEVPGSGGLLCGGWNQFGNIGTTDQALHGQRAAVVLGPDNGTWAVSGFWQTHDASQGESFAVTGYVRHPSQHPLTGQCAAIVNVEWRDADDELIDYYSYTALDADSAPDIWWSRSFTSPPAPPGTATARLLVGVLQSPTDPVPETHFDQLTFFSTTSPTHNESQWPDFPGGRVLNFAGYSWRVKGPGQYSPGPNIFRDDEEAVHVDADGHLHLTQGAAGNLYSTEIVHEQSLGYGDYILTTRGRLDILAPGVVLGLFLWEYDNCWDESYLWWNPYNEIDIEYSRWNDPAADNAQFVAQPYGWTGNRERFAMDFAEDEIVSHAMRWWPDRVEFRVWRGPAEAEGISPLVHSWTYAGPHVPRPEQPRMHLNLWLFGDAPAQPQEVVFTDFRFIPQILSAAPRPPLPGPPTRLLGAVPNPFNPRTTIRLRLKTAAQDLQLLVCDMRGRRVAVLHQGSLTAGDHRFVWEGKDPLGQPLGAGVYLVVLQGDGFMEAQRITLVK